MTTVVITLSDKLEEFVQAETAAGQHASASECVLALIQEGRCRRAWAKAEELVMQGLVSPKREMTAEDWAGLHHLIDVRSRRA